VQDINQFVYCPRRLYYQTFLDTVGQNYELVDGRTSHEHASRRGGWTNELYLRSERHGLHGKIDVVENDDGTVTPIERKRAESGAYYESDELQLAAYCLLLEDNIPESVAVGYIYTESNDRRHTVRIRDWHREQVAEIVSIVDNMTVDDIPPLTDNPSKCEACSARSYCMPAETAALEPEKAHGTGWAEAAGTPPGELDAGDLG
jgi:CRISPR-associated exonuclease Cas4